MTTEHRPILAEVTLRPAQEAILAYEGGPMAISAVPGAGKTFILEQLAARLIARQGVRPSEVLVLTYMRSAALNIKRRVAKTLAARGRTAYGLQALTIHAFALAIVRRARGEDAEEQPIVVMSEAEARRALMAGLETWLGMPGNRERWELARRGERGRDDDPFMATVRAAKKAIGEAKHHGHPPDVADALLGGWRPEIAFLYRHYLEAQRQLDASDYDDLIHQAIAHLEASPSLRAWYQAQIRYVMEDEAQDSTPAQQRLIELLTSPAEGGAGNLVRVGDSNQAIMTSFTHNDPKFFRAFCVARDLDRRHFPMPESSRSALPIIQLANRLVDLVGGQHPDLEVRKAFTGQHVHPATAGKPNPMATCPPTWTFYEGKTKADYGPREELGVLTHVRAYLKANPTRRAAILLRTSKQCDAYLTAATAMGIAIQHESRPGVGSRACLALLEKVLAFLALPAEHQAERLLDVVKARAELLGLEWRDWKALKGFVAEQGAEALLYPAVGLPPRRPHHVDPGDYAAALETGAAMRGFLAARHLPAVELLPTVAAKLLGNAHAAAIAAKAAAIATRHRDPARDPLEGLRIELAEVAKAIGERGELVQPPAELAEPEGGRLTIMTMHSAKGMEFDAVWLPALGYYYKQKGHFPWDPEQVEIWDREGFMLEFALKPEDQRPESPQAAEEAAKRLAVAESLRLLYVGITRAERELHLSAAGFDEQANVPPHVAWLAATCERRMP